MGGGDAFAQFSSYIYIPLVDLDGYGIKRCTVLASYPLVVNSL